jgi:hypothetical protein
MWGGDGERRGSDSNPTTDERYRNHSTALRLEQSALLIRPWFSFYASQSS